MNYLSDVIYCIGSPEGKRRDFRKNVSEEWVYADNDEVLASVTKDGKTYFMIGDAPFSEMTVKQYVSYHRSVVAPDKTDFSYFRRLLWKTCRAVLLGGALVSNMPRFAYRVMQCFTYATEKTKVLAVNFDGTEYSRGNQRFMRRFIRTFAGKYKLLVGVSDARFIPAGSTVRRYYGDGSYNQLSLSATGAKLKGGVRKSPFTGVYPGNSRVRNITVSF